MSQAAGCATLKEWTVTLGSSLSRRMWPSTSFCTARGVNGRGQSPAVLLSSRA